MARSNVGALDSNLATGLWGTSLRTAKGLTVMELAPFMIAIRPIAPARQHINDRSSRAASFYAARRKMSSNTVVSSALRTA
jgi:hypothetical protein